MTCSELETLIHPYLDGEFDSSERFELERHLQTCTECAAQVQSEARFKQALRAKLREATDRAAPDALRERVVAGLRRSQRGALGWQVARMAAAAAIVAVGVGTYLVIRPSLSRDRFVTEAALRHARGLPFEIQPVSPERAEAWFQGKLDHRVAVPRLQNATVAGARLSHLTDRPAAYISYEVPCPSGSGAQKKMGLFVVDDSQDSMDASAFPEIEVANRHGYNVAMWKQGEVVYELVSDLDEADIRKLLQQGEQPTMVLDATAPQLQVQTVGHQPR